MPVTRKNKTRKNKTRKKRIFKKNDYYSGDGFLTSVWGPALWHSLHTISFNYPINPTKDDKHNYITFIKSMENVLPCKHCRINLKKNFKQLPLKMSDMKNRETFSKYIYNLHELINKMLNKKSGLTYNQVKERYEHFRSRCTDDNKIELVIKEDGCVKPLYGKKSKCVINIVPKNTKCKTFKIDKRCIMKKN